MIPVWELLVGQTGSDTCLPVTLDTSKGCGGGGGFDVSTRHGSLITAQELLKNIDVLPSSIKLSNWFFF